MDVIICGRKIGHASGWDVGDLITMVFYDFDAIPALKEDFPTVEPLSVELETGWFRYYDSEGKITVEKDIIDTLWKVKRNA